ncbi:hypothetical protein GN316_00185 [Xylophilus sp. Kf1]|nr:hypothetical protein [Xylophilus sp. Kf1]
MRTLSRAAVDPGETNLAHVHDIHSFAVRRCGAEGDLMPACHRVDIAAQQLYSIMSGAGAGRLAVGRQTNSTSSISSGACCGIRRSALAGISVCPISMRTNAGLLSNG